MVQLRIYTSLRKEIRRLSYEEKGMLLDAMLAYAEDKSLLPLSGKADVIWDIIQERIDAQHSAYDHQCAVNKRNRNESSRIVTNRHESSQVNLTLNTSTNTNTNINQVTKVKKRKKRDFEERSVTDADFKDLFLDLNEGGANDKSNGENC